LARLIDRIRPGALLPAGGREAERASFSDYLKWFSFQGTHGLLGGVTQTLQGDKEPIPAGFAGYASQAYQGNGVVFAVSMARMLLFAEARFQFQRLEGGRPTAMFGDQSLGSWSARTGTWGPASC
jgi:hypothetical protein